MYDFVVAANRSSRLHTDARLMVTQECLLEPKTINPEDAGNMILQKGSIILQRYAVPKPTGLQSRWKMLHRNMSYEKEKGDRQIDGSVKFISWTMVHGSQSDRGRVWGTSDVGETFSSLMQQKRCRIGRCFWPNTMNGGMKINTIWSGFPEPADVLGCAGEKRF